MNDQRRASELSADELFELIRNAVAHGVADQVAQPVQRIADRGVRVTSGVTGGVFWALVLWTILPALLALFLFFVGGMAALAS